MKNRSIALTMAFAGLAAIAQADVTISSPANNATTSTSIRVVASATMSAPITAIQIYLDGAVVYQAAATSLDRTLTTSTGQHRITVKSWDKYGASMSRTVYVNATATAGVPSTAAGFYDIESMSGWGYCTVCAGGGGNAIYSMTQGIASPSIDGRSTHFFVGGTTPYSHGLWWRRMANTDSSKSRFVLEMRYYVKEPLKSEGLEFAVNQAYGGQRWKWSTQCTYSLQLWRAWDSKNGGWVSTGIPCTRPKAYTWQHVVFEYARMDGKAQFISVTVDGQKHYMNKSFYPEVFPDNGMNVHFQLNGDRYQQDYSVWMDKMSLRYW